MHTYLILVLGLNPWMYYQLVQSTGSMLAWASPVPLGFTSWYLLGPLSHSYEVHLRGRQVCLSLAPLLSFTQLSSLDSSLEMLPKPWQRQLMGLPKGLTGFVWAVCFFYLMLAFTQRNVGAFCCCSFLGLSTVRLS